MPYTIRKLPDAPVILVHSVKEKDVLQEMANAITDMTRLLDEQTEKVFLVNDMRDVTLTLDEIMHAANMSARGQNTMLHHPNLRESIYVLTDGFVKTALRGLDSATFGLLKTRTFDTVEEALEYCRAQTLLPDF